MDIDYDNLFAYERKHGNVIMTVIANMSAELVLLDTHAYGELLVDNYDDSAYGKIRPYEVMVLSRNSM